ncbi:ATP-binding protein [Natronoflexus pectinivorans]|uniref:histidine kinase n=1 Tax=Natronoflexus pectinivorans TaxID=682526 RepID=A0A4R2GI21_9BACT|nr:ATP-binding protein [Natronoflexus pectinivorans]TCO07923.1 signal transduction histidine kinase [Natronoflexus pectinivorans]
MKPVRNNHIIESAPYAYAHHKIVLNEDGLPVDYIILDVNPAFEKLTGFLKRKVINKKITEVLPDIKKDKFNWIEFYGSLALAGGQKEFDQYAAPLAKWYRVQAVSSERLYFSTFFTDITDHYVLSEVSAYLNGQHNDIEAYDYLCQKMVQISGASYVALNKYDKSGNFYTTVAFAGIKNHIIKGVEILGFQVVNKEWPFDPHREELIQHKKTTYFDTLTDLIGYATPAKAVRLLEKTFKLGQCAVIKATNKSVKIGDYTLIFRKDEKLINSTLAETLADMTGIFMQRLDVEQSFNRQFEFQKLIGIITSDFISCNVYNFEEKIKRMLHLTGSFLDAEHAFLTLFHKDICSNACNWYSGKMDDETAKIIQFRFTNWVWWKNQFRKKNYLILEDINELPEEASIERSSFQNFNIRSVLSIAIKFHDLTMGYLVFSTFSRTKIWNSSDINNLLIISNSIADALIKSEAEQQLLESETRYKQLSESIPVGIFQCEMEELKLFRFTYVSDRIEEFINIPVNEVLTRPEKILQRVKLGYKKRLLLSFLKSFRDYSLFTSTFEIEKNNEVLWIETRAYPEKQSSGSVRWNGVFIDVTEKIMAGKVLENAKEEAEAANRAKSEFVANMSHEIRTPLNGIIGFTELLKKTPLSPVQQRYVNNVHISGHSLLHIINDILDLSKIESGKLDIEINPTRISDIMEQSMDTVRYQALQKEIKLILDVPDDLPAVIYTDSNRLKQVLLNILGNAVKFTKQGVVELKVRFKPEGEDYGRFFFSVRDTGIGITAEQGEKLFKAFSQADSSITRKFGGTGLGLIISNLILEKFGSQIEYESEYGEGSRFFFSIKTKYEFKDESIPEPSAIDFAFEKIGHQVGVGGEKAESRINKNPNILLAEDVEMNMELLKNMIMKLAPEATFFEAFNGEEAVKIFTQNKIDLVLMDIQMPILDGIDASKMIREKEEGDSKQTPIVAITAGVLQHEKERALAAGINDFLTKPFNSSTMMEVLKKHLSVTEEVIIEYPVISDKIDNHFNRKALLERIRHNQTLYQKIIKNLPEQLRTYINRLSVAIEKRDLFETETISHSIKGLALNMELNKMSDLAEKILTEKGLNDQEKVVILEEIKQEYSFIIQKLNNEPKE